LHSPAPELRPVWTILGVHRLKRAAAITSALGLVSIVSCGGAPAVSESRTIEIGVDLPLSGDDGRAGTPTLNGVLYFVHQHPTIAGFKVVVDAHDDTVGGIHNPGKGAENVQTMVTDPQILGMVGPFDSSVARAQLAIANQAHLAMISPSTSSRCLTKEPFLPRALNPNQVEISCKDAGLPSPKELRPSGVNNYFRLAATDELQGPAAADYSYRNLHLLRVAVLSDHEAYGQALADGFRTRFTRLGGSIVANYDFDPGSKFDVLPFLRAAKREGAQGLYFGGTTANHGCLIRAQMATVFDAGEITPFLGGDGIAQDPACVRDAATNATGIYATVPAVNSAHVTAALPAIAGFKAEFGKTTDLGAYTMSAYDATGVLYLALERAITAGGGTLPVRAAVLAQLAGTTAYEGATGTFGFDAAGDSTMRVLSLYEPAAADPRAGWNWVHAVDYTAALPY
jgi:branched-chain amino acid transport system substrate-binding protein